MFRIFSFSLAVMVCATAYFMHAQYYETEVRTIFIEGKFRRQIANSNGSIDISYIATDTGMFRLPVHGELGGYENPRELWKSLHIGCAILVETAKRAPGVTQINAIRVDTIVDGAHCTKEDGAEYAANPEATDKADPLIVKYRFAQTRKNETIELVSK